LLDAARLTRRGVEVMAIVWNSFEHAARMQTSLQNLSEIPLVLVADQVPGETINDQRRKGVMAADEILSRWGKRLDVPEGSS
jgi:hypothetical protein